MVDHEREMVLVAERQNPDTAEREILAVGRLVRADEANEAEFAMLISDLFQHHGLGTEMVRRLLEFARAERQRFSINSRESQAASKASFLTRSALYWDFERQLSADHPFRAAGISLLSLDWRRERLLARQ